MTSERAWDGWIDWLARRLVGYAARRAPEALWERLQEEWLADLAAQRGPVLRLGFAVGVCRAAAVIAYQQAASSPSPSPAGSAGHGHFIRFPRDNFQLFAGGTATFVFFTSLLAAVLYGLGFALAVT